MIDAAAATSSQSKATKERMVGDKKISSPALSTTSSDAGSSTKKAGNGNFPNKPVDSRFTQQNLPAWQPILTPYNVIPGLIFVALTFISMGVFFLIKSDSLEEVKIPIDKVEEFTTNHNFPFMKGPIYQYFELEGFYQNELSYTKSVDWEQLKNPSILRNADCVGETNDPNVFPCGLIADSYLLDGPVTVGSIVFSSSSDNISWPKDTERYYNGSPKFSIAQGLVFPPKSWVAGVGKNPLNLNLHNDGSYITYPDLARGSFMNWMKIAGLPTFRKLYGKYDGDIAKGSYEIKFTSNSIYPQAKKYLVFSNLNWIGGKNPQLGFTYCITGCIFLACGLFFLVRHWRMPKNLSDKKKLSWLQITDSFDDLRKGSGSKAAGSRGFSPVENDLLESFGGTGVIGVDGEPEVMEMAQSDVEDEEEDL